MAWPSLEYQAAVLAVVFVTVWLQWAPALTVVAFLPLAAKVTIATLRPADALNLRSLGWQEVGHALLFTTLLIAAYHLSFPVLSSG